MKTTFALPASARKPFLAVHKYLEAKSIPRQTVSRMIEEGILYQSKGNYAVFVTPQKDLVEVHGANGHKCLKASPDRFWYITSGPEKPQYAYICESSVDAVSLMLLRKKAGDTEPSVFISIGEFDEDGQKAIDRIIRRMKTVIAVNNGASGEKCREDNRGLWMLVPVLKDWNSDLQAGNTEGAYH